MSSHSTYSNTIPLQGCAYVRYRTRSFSPPISITRNNDPADFNSIGAHLPSPASNTFHPYEMDISEDEVSKQVKDSNSISRAITSHQTPPKYVEYNVLTSSPKLSPTQRGPYLPESEIPVLHCQLSRKKEVSNSSCYSSYSTYNTTTFQHSIYHPSQDIIAEKNSQNLPLQNIVAKPNCSPVFEEPPQCPTDYYSTHSTDETREDDEHINAEYRRPRPPHPYSEWDLYDPEYGRYVLNRE